MKGIVFTEFFEMVEGMFGDNMVDDLIDSSELESNGAYTSIGTYDASEMIQLVTQLHLKTNIPINDLQYAFGKHLHKGFTNSYSSFFEEADNLFDFLESIDNYIHVEVLKLYPDAELPKFDAERISDKEMKLKYMSSRCMAYLALGLIESSADYFKEEVKVNVELLNERGSEVLFHLNLV